MDEGRFVSSHRCLRDRHGSKVEKEVEDQGSSDEKTDRERSSRER